ncbi:MAG TPA: alpha/beta hydrolase [Symbiobacteriaceae bacterium]|nr:alpha/beta hydrolase [Symbiobacteriaceae bacterium]
MQDLMLPCNGIHLHVLDYGGSGEAVIFLHYSSGNGTMWNGVIPSFQPHYRVIVPEIRGHGRSDKPPTGYHIETLAHDVAALMDGLRVSKAHLVGSSMGGEVAAAFAALYPERALSIVCEGAYFNEFGPNGVQGVPDEEIDARKVELRAARAARVRPTYASPEEALAAEAAAWADSGLWNAWLEGHARANICQLPDGRYGRSFPAWALEQYMEAYYDLRFETYYRRVRCPVLFLLPEEDAQNARVQGCLAMFRECLAQSEVVVLPGLPHAFMHMINPEAVSAVILRFLGR